MGDQLKSDTIPGLLPDSSFLQFFADCSDSDDLVCFSQIVTGQFWNLRF